MAAGDIARALRVPHNTLSVHLTILANAGLVASQRRGPSIIYAIEFKGAHDLLAFLVEDCCQGKPEACNALLEHVMSACCG